MTNQFLLTAGVLLILNLGGNVLIRGNLAPHESDVRLINTSGKQRMLSAQIDHLANEIVLEQNRDHVLDRSALAEAAAELFTNHIELVKVAGSERLQSMLFDRPMHLDRRLRQYIEHAEQIALSQDTDLVDKSFSHLRSEAPLILRDLDALTSQFQLEQENARHRTYVLAIGGLTGSMVFLAIIGLFIFRPMETRLQHHTTELEDLISDRTDELEIYRVTLENISDAVFLTDEDGRLTFICPNSEIIFGYRPDELRTRKVISSLLGDDLFNHEELRAFGELPNIDCLITDKFGKRHQLLVSVKRVSINGTSILYSCRDVTELRDAREELDNFFNLSPDLLSISNTDGYFKRINPAFVRTLGYTEDELLSKPFIDLVHHADLRATEKQIGILDQGETTDSFENRYRCADGTYRWLSWTSRPGKRGSIYSVARDVTERKRFETELIAAREKAEEMNRLKDIFLSNMSHEVRTPLTAIIATADLMSQEEYDDDSINEFVRFIREGGSRLLQTFNSVLELAQLESQNIVLRPEAMNIVSEICETTRFFDQQAAKCSLGLTFNSDRNNIPVYLDKIAIGRITMNLISNAIKFTREGEISVNVTDHKDFVRLIVKDTGIGISDDFIPHLFDEFRQESSGLSRGFEGNGLGLTISKRLIDLMGGKISVVSKKSEGSTFTIDLPKSAS